MVRILKVARVLRASRIVARWQDHVSISYAISSLVRFLLWLLVLAHWLACFWGLVGDAGSGSQGLDSSGNGTEVKGVFSASAGSIEWGGRYNEGLTWVQKYSLQELNAMEMYGISLYVALNNIFGGSCEINPANPTEFYAQGWMLLIGSSVWAYAIGSVCGIITTLDPASIEYRQTMDELNFFMRDQSLPNELRVDLRSYFRNTLYQIRAKKYEYLLGRMSMKLRGDAAYRMCEFRLRQVPYLVHPELEAEFMSNLAIKCGISVYSHLERVPCMRLIIVDRGIIAKRGRLGMAGASFGADVILSNINLRDIGDAIALTFVQTTELEQADIFALLPEYPKAYHVVRRAALQLALLRALTKASRLVQEGSFKLLGRFAPAAAAAAGGGEGGDDTGAPAASNGDSGDNGDNGISALFDRAMQQPLHPNEPVPAAADTNATPVFFPVRLKYRALRGGNGSFKQRPGGEDSGERVEREVSLWGKRPHIARVPTQEERMIDLKTKVDATHTLMTQRLTRLETLVTQIAEGQRANGMSFKARRRSNVDVKGPRAQSVLTLASRTPESQTPEREELRDEAALTRQNSASISSPFDA